MSLFKTISTQLMLLPLLRLVCGTILTSLAVQGCEGVSDTNHWNNVHDPANPKFIPAPPTIFLEHQSAHSIIVNWKRNSEFDVRCDIYRKTPGGTYIKVGTQASDSLAFTDTLGVDTSIPYFYRICTYSAHDLPSMSAEVQFDTTYYSPPVLLTARKMNGGSWVYLEWKYTASVGNECIIERSAGGGPFEELDHLAITQTTYADSWSPANAAYRIRIRGKGNISEPSNVMMP